MARCTPEMLTDLASLLTELRGWPRVVERRPLVFYVGSEPLLHFHALAGGRRRADVKAHGASIELELPRPLPGPVAHALLRELRGSHRDRTPARGRPRKLVKESCSSRRGVESCGQMEHPAGSIPRGRRSRCGRQSGRRCQPSARTTCGREARGVHASRTPRMRSGAIVAGPRESSQRYGPQNLVREAASRSPTAP
jgi:hypothetical protein